MSRRGYPTAGVVELGIATYKLSYVPALFFFAVIARLYHVKTQTCTVYVIVVPGLCYCLIQIPRRNDIYTLNSALVAFMGEIQSQVPPHPSQIKLDTPHQNRNSENALSCYYVITAAL